jgi:hypothetical protein
MDSLVDDDEGKMGKGFTSADELEAVDIRPGDRPRPTYISAKLDPEYKKELIALLKEYKDCFAWEYYEMPGLDRKLVEHHLPIKSGYRPFKQAPRKLKDEIMEDVKKESLSYMKHSLYDNVDMHSGFQVLFSYIRRMER